MVSLLDLRFGTPYINYAAPYPATTIDDGRRSTLPTSLIAYNDNHRQVTIHTSTINDTLHIDNRRQPNPQPTTHNDTTMPKIKSTNANP